MQQSATDQVEIGERCGDLEAVQVLGESAIAHLAEPKHPLDHPDRVLDFGPHLRFGAILRHLDLVEPTSTTVLAVREVLGTRRSGAVVHAEITLGFKPDLTMADVDRRIEAMKTSLRQEIGDADIAIVAAAS